MIDIEPPVTTRYVVLRPSPPQDSLKCSESLRDGRKNTLDRRRVYTVQARKNVEHNRH